MFFWSIVLILIGIYSSYIFGKSRIKKLVYSTNLKPKSQYNYHAQYVLSWCLLPALIVYFSWAIFEEQIIQNLILDSFEYVEGANNTDFSEGKSQEIINAAAQYKSLKLTSQISFYISIIIIMVLGSLYAVRKINIQFNAQDTIEKYIKYLLIFCSSIAVLTTIGIIFSLIFESFRFFSQVSLFEFLFSTEWYPFIPIREGQAAAEGSFGAVPIFAGTFLVMIVAMCVAAPIGLLTAIYLSEYASQKVRKTVKPLLEILAGIPTIVYGFFAFVTVAPFVKSFGQSIGIDASPTSALAAGLVMGVMIIPFISSLSDDVIRAVPQSLRDGSMGLGATKAETIYNVVLPAAIPGLVGAVLLAVSRAIGETMIVVMAAGLSASLTINPLDSVTTVTVQIVSLLTGDTEFDDIKTLSAFGLGLALFFFTLLLNIFALSISRRLAERYD